MCMLTEFEIFYSKISYVPYVCSQCKLDFHTQPFQYGMLMYHIKYMHTNTGEVAQVTTEAAVHAKTLNLAVVRLCFQAFLMDEHGKFTIPTDPVYSHTVHDSSK